MHLLNFIKFGKGAADYIFWTMLLPHCLKALIYFITFKMFFSFK